MKKQSTKAARPRVKTASKKSESETDFPGYPLYPSTEDIMNRGERVDVDLDAAIENLPTGKNLDPTINEIKTPLIDQKSNLTKDDLQALPSDEIESTGDDEVLTNRVWPVDFAGTDLDVPGSETDDAQEQIGSEDEENNSYSLGSDRQAGLEEDQS